MIQRGVLPLTSHHIDIITGSEYAPKSINGKKNVDVLKVNKYKQLKEY